MCVHAGTLFTAADAGTASIVKSALSQRHWLASETTGVTEPLSDTFRIIAVAGSNMSYNASYASWKSGAISGVANRGMVSVLTTSESSGSLLAAAPMTVWEEASPSAQMPYVCLRGKSFGHGQYGSSTDCKSLSYLSSKHLFSLPCILKLFVTST